jgi:spermidine synthase
MMEAVRPLLHRAECATEHLQPFVSTLAGKRSLHFSIHETQSQIDLQHPERLDLEYTRLMAAFLLLQPAPRAIAMVGLGGGTLARLCHRVLPQACIAVAEINPHVTALRDSFGVPADDERFVVVPADGAAVVRQLEGRADVLLVDGYTAEGMPRQLSSQHFFDACAAALVPGGVLVVNVYADERRRTQVEERIRRSFGGLCWTVPDSANSNQIVFALRPAAGDGADLPPALRLGPLRRPAALDGEEWQQLQGDFARVMGAWKDWIS